MLKSELASNADPISHGMVTNFHGKEPCPWLPQVTVPLGPETTRRHSEKGEAFYLAALSYAQSLWLEGKPAQAILQLNKAWMADLRGDEAVLEEYPAPYRALVWIVRKSKKGTDGFMGNPVRHFQHLASRMSGPRSEVRSWRAWACFHIVSSELEGGDYSKDGAQIAREGLWIPRGARVLNEIKKKGWDNELKQMFLL